MYFDIDDALEMMVLKRRVSLRKSYNKNGT
jgi:hypothetical protein